MTRLQCGFCGSEFEARRSDAKFCGPQCKQKNFQAKANRLPVSTPSTVVRRSSNGRDVKSEPSGLVATVTGSLRSADQLGTVTGQSALGLAEHLSRGAISGSERAALTKALHETMQRALAAADDDPNDPLVAIRRRARAKRDALRMYARNGSVPAELVDFDM